MSNTSGPCAGSACSSIPASSAAELALRTTAQIATGTNTAVTAGSPPVNQDNACGFAPKLGYIFGWNMANFTSVQTSGADLTGFCVGAYDGTQYAFGFPIEH